MQIKIFRQSCLEPHVRRRNSVFCCQSDGHLKVVVLIRQSCVMARCHNLRQCKLILYKTHRTKIFTFPTLSANRETPPAPDCAAIVLRKRGEGSFQMSSTFFLSSMIGASCPCRRLSTSFRDVFRLKKIL